MTVDNCPPADRLLFSAILTPHRSLPAVGFRVIMTAVLGLNLIASVVFYRIGAWPVIGFCGADVLILYLAFRSNFRAAAALEAVEVTATEIHLRKVSADGQSIDYRFNPSWVRLEIERLPDEGVTRIALFSHGRGVPMAEFLNPEDRTSFAEALAGAIAAARRGGVMG